MCLVGGKSSEAWRNFFPPHMSWLLSTSTLPVLLAQWYQAGLSVDLLDIFFFFAILYCFLHARPIILIPKISSTNQKNLLNKPVRKEREVPDTHVWIRGAETFPADPTRCLLLFDWPWLRRVTLLAYRRDLARGQRQVSKTIFPEAKLLWKNEYVPAYNLLLR